MSDLSINFLNNYQNHNFSMLNERTREVTEVDKNILTDPELNINISGRLLDSISNNFLNFRYKFYLTDGYNTRLDVSNYFGIKGDLKQETIVKVNTDLFDSDIMIGEQNSRTVNKDINARIIFPYLFIEFNILGQIIQSNIMDLTSFYKEWNSSSFKLRYNKINKLDEAMDKAGYRIKPNRNADKATYEEFGSMARIGITEHFKSNFR